MPDEPTQTSGQPRVKVQAAVRTIQKASDLFAVAEGRLIAARAVRFGEHVFDEEQGPKPVAEVAVVDLEGPEPRPLGIVSISWVRIIRQLRAADPDSWQIGRLVEESEYKAKELEPPGRRRRPGGDRREARPLPGCIAARTEAARVAGRRRAGRLRRRRRNPVPLSRDDGRHERGGGGHDARRRPRLRARRRAGVPGPLVERERRLLLRQP